MQKTIRLLILLAITLSFSAQAEPTVVNKSVIHGPDGMLQVTRFDNQTLSFDLISGGVIQKVRSLEGMNPQALEYASKLAIKAASIADIGLVGGSICGTLLGGYAGIFAAIPFAPPGLGGIVPVIFLGGPVGSMVIGTGTFAVLYKALSNRFKQKQALGVLFRASNTIQGNIFTKMPVSEVIEIAKASLQPVPASLPSAPNIEK